MRHIMLIGTINVLIASGLLALVSILPDPEQAGDYNQTVLMVVDSNDNSSNLIEKDAAPKNISRLIYTAHQTGMPVIATSHANKYGYTNNTVWPLLDSTTWNDNILFSPHQDTHSDMRDILGFLEKHEASTVVLAGSVNNSCFQLYLNALTSHGVDVLIPVDAIGKPDMTALTESEYTRYGETGRYFFTKTPETIASMFDQRSTQVARLSTSKNNNIAIHAGDDSDNTR